VPSFWYKGGKQAMAKADIDMDTVDYRIALLMTNTTADTEKDATTISGGTGFTTLDEYDGTGYARVALTSEAVAYDDANDRVEIDASDLAPAWAALGAGTRQAQGLLLFAFITNDASSIPLAWIDTGGFPFSGNGGAVNITWNAEGILQVT
jgi:hypothetical protein